MQSAEDSSPKDVKITIETQDKDEYKAREAGISKGCNEHHKTELKHDYQERQFAIVDNDRNDERNPNREATNVAGLLVRRIDSVEILPRPFRTTNQLIVCSYLSLLCCFCVGAMATEYALKTKMLRNKGLYSAATDRAKKAVRWIVAAVICGLVITAILTPIMILEFA